MKKILLLFSLMLMAAARVFSHTVNLEEVRTLALASSRSLAKYNLAIRSSVLDEKSQFYTMLPSVSAGYSASMEYLRDWNFVNPFDTFRTGMDIAITQKIFEGGKSFIQRAITAIATESVRNEALAEYFNVIDAADNAYYAALEAEATLESEVSSLQTALANFTIAEVRLSNGMITSGDFLRVLADREARENSTNQARRSLTLAMMRLRSITGLAQITALEPVNFDAYDGLIRALAEVTDEEADALYEKLWKTIAATNPSLARASLNSLRAEKNLTLARRDFAPVVSATVFSAGFNYSAASGFGSTSGGGVSIRGSIPLDYWVLNNRIEKSKIARDSSALDYISAGVNLETELQSALLTLFSVSSSALHSRLTLDYAERHFEYVEQRYRLLQSSISDLGEASTLLINSRNNHIKAHYGFLQSLSKLRSLGAVADENILITLLMGNKT